MENFVTPMRAADLRGDTSLVEFPCIASPKFDGYRCTTQSGHVLSKNLKPIPNIFVQCTLGHQMYHGLDGELIVGDPREDPLQRTSSGVTRRDGSPDFTLYVFDMVDDLTLTFELRLAKLSRKLKSLHGLGCDRVMLVPHVSIKDEKELLAYEVKCLARGYEGVMVRSPDGLYKQGGAEPRATVAEGYCSKLKRRTDFEARIVGVTEEMENTNPAELNELGGNKRSLKKGGMRGKGTLGSFQVVGVNGRWEGVPFDVGTGPMLTKASRTSLWAVKDTLPGRILKVASGKTPKTFKAPQFPTALDFRDEGDM